MGTAEDDKVRASMEYMPLRHRIQAMRYKIFISSVLSEFAEERQKLVEFLSADALLGIFF